MNINDLIGPQLERLQRNALIVAIVGLVLTVGGYFANTAQLGAEEGARQFFVSYLFAFMFWLGVTTGSLAWLMISHVTGGGWAFMLRRMLEAATRNLPLVFAMFVPIIFGMGGLYEWMHPEKVREHHGEELYRVMLLKAPYLNQPGFIIRAVVYFAIWMAFAYFLNRWSRIQDERNDERVAGNLNRWSAFGLLIYVMTLTFASIDWVMSLTPLWYSSLFGVIFVIGQGLSTLALMAVLIASLAGRTAMVQKIQTDQPRYFRDLGNLHLAFVLLWAYTNFSQFMLIWSGNIPEEVTWYVRRTGTSWLIIGTFLAIFHFVVPFFCLLSSALKVKITNLAKFSAFIILIRFIDLWFYVAPTFRPELAFYVTDLGAPLLLGGIWLWAWAREVKGRQLLPLHDPRLQEHMPLVREIMGDAMPGTAHGAAAHAATAHTATTPADVTTTQQGTQQVVQGHA